MRRTSTSSSVVTSTGKRLFPEKRKAGANGRGALMISMPDFMQQFLTHNANRTQFLTNRLQLLSIKTIKGKIAHFLLEQAGEQGDTFTLNRNQTELADFFGVARPSLARSLSEMIEEGIIDVNKKEYTILDKKKLRELLV
jgi:CRP-like cAMP-binding protein